MSDKAKKTKSKKESARKTPKPKPAVETKGLADAPMLSSSEDKTLGTLPDDLEMKTADEQAPKRSIQKQQEKANGDMPENKEASVPGDLSAEADTAPAEPLHLPRGALIAFRKSGGLHFSSREVVLYPDGRVAYDTHGVPQKEYNRLRRVMNDGQMASLRRLLDQTGFWKETGGGEQNPDAFAYEINARIGQRTNQVQVFDGSIDDRLKPLLDQLTKLLPE